MRLTYAPAGAWSWTFVSNVPRMVSPRPRRWCSGSTAMSSTWKYQPPSPRSRPMPTVVAVGRGTT